jgi:hypothetical protein
MLPNSPGPFGMKRIAVALPRGVDAIISVWPLFDSGVVRLRQLHDPGIKQERPIKR